jgi:hypothetical protein
MTGTTHASLRTNLIDSLIVRVNSAAKERHAPRVIIYGETAAPADDMVYLAIDDEMGHRIGTIDTQLGGADLNTDDLVREADALTREMAAVVGAMDGHSVQVPMVRLRATVESVTPVPRPLTPTVSVGEVIADLMDLSQRLDADYGALVAMARRHPATGPEASRLHAKAEGVALALGKLTEVLRRYAIR